MWLTTPKDEANCPEAPTEQLEAAIVGTVRFAVTAQQSSRNRCQKFENCSRTWVPFPTQQGENVPATEPGSRVDLAVPFPSIQFDVEIAPDCTSGDAYYRITGIESVHSFSVDDSLVQ